VLKSLADAGLGIASVLANLHHKRIIPLMEGGAPYLRDGRDGQPRVVGALAVGTRPLPLGLCSHEGEACHQP
jgi:hypothetical protein